MKKMLVFVFLLMSVAGVSAMSPEQDILFSETKKNNPIPCCRSGAAVPPCEKCYEMYLRKHYDAVQQKSDKQQDKVREKPFFEMP